MIGRLTRFLRKYDFPICVLHAGSILFRLASVAVSSVMLKIRLRMLGCPWGQGLKADGRVRLQVFRKGAIRIGSHVMLLSRYGSNLVGITNPCTLVCSGDGEIEIGNHSGMSGAVISSCSSVRIGEHVKIGGNVRIFDHDFHSLDPCHRRGKEDKEQVKTRPVVIGDDVFIGTNAIILKGVTIGDRAIIGAGSVVSCDVPADEIWAGNPARRVRGSAPDSGE